MRPAFLGRRPGLAGGGAVLALLAAAGAGQAQVRAETAGAAAFARAYEAHGGVSLDDRFRMLFGAAADVGSPPSAREEAGPFAGLLETPLAGARITSAFGMRLHPILGSVRMHQGIDLAAPLGSPVFAAGDGVVEQAEWLGGYGRWVKLAHPGGWETGYGHLSRWTVAPGEHVRRGQLIAYSGSTGRSTGPHLHYEVIRGGVKVDPRVAGALLRPAPRVEVPAEQVRPVAAAEPSPEPAPPTRWAWGLIAPPTVASPR